MARAYLTRRALLDIEAIDTYSVHEWGDRVARQYLDDLFAAIRRLEDAPRLLLADREVSTRLRFYRAREHVLVCDVIEDNIYVLTISHTKMDLPTRLLELEPQLLHESDLLHRRIAGGANRP